MKTSYKLALLACVCGQLCGCSLNRTAAKYTANIISAGMPAYLEDGDEQTARETLPGAIKLSEAVLQTDPENRQLLSVLAQGNCGYAFMFLEDENRARASAFYQRGAEFSARALKSRGILSADGDFNAKAVFRRDAPLVFWNAFCRAGYAQLNLETPDAMADISKLDPLLDSVLALESDYYFNGAHALKAAILAMRPPMFGGNPAKSKEHFEKALEGSGAAFLPNKLMYAKAYAVRAQDAALFEKLLNDVIGAEVSAPESRLANSVAKIKAKKLLETKNELF
jgi:hypothetical protein